jgi:tripartite-type tricarboxylate transporter receptor subunit TctC
MSHPIRCGRAFLRRAAGVMTLLLSLTAAGAASAQPGVDYPSRPITLVVPFAAGGPTDAVARHLAAAMSPLLRQPIVIDNRAGLGGTQAPAAMARGPADGYTILLHHIGMATAPTLFRGLTYDPQRDFEPVGLVASAPMVLLTHPSVPATSTRQLIAYLRANEATVAMGYAGPGAASHLCGLLLTTVLRLDLIAVPYKGTGPALAALEKGAADLLCDQTTAAMPAIRSGKVKVFAGDDTRTCRVAAGGADDHPSRVSARCSSPSGTACMRRAARPMRWSRRWHARCSRRWPARPSSPR